MVVAIATGFVWNCGGWRGKSPEERIEWMANKIQSQLDLDASQTEVLQKLKKEILAKRIELKMNEVSQFEEEISGLVLSEKLDEPKFTKLVSEKITARAELAKFVTKKFAEFHKVLNQKQKEIVVEKFKKFSKHMAQ